MVGTVSSAGQTPASPIVERIRERSAAPRAAQPGAQPSDGAPTPSRAPTPSLATTPNRATAPGWAPTAGTAPGRTPDTRAEGGVPAWKQRIVASLEEQLDRPGASRGSRAENRLTAGNVDERITNLSRELRSRPQGTTGYAAQNTAPSGVVVNRVV